ncbi:hypothetical protein [Swingsia samuiensis]|uniref:hypothetical protein n=1 Tax=Swingsia samuiensis TaxID=1293412 RepID=UPI001C658BAD|nr:hypothetical protein [Swingsia samuiensis]
MKSYRAAKRKLRLSVRHLSHKVLNNRVENSHLLLRKRERVMQNSDRQADVRGSSPSFLPSVIFSFHPLLTNAFIRRIHRIQAFAQWKVAAFLAA